MNYLMILWRIAPIIITCTLVLYTIIYFGMKNRRLEKPVFYTIGLELLLVGWFVAFIYITQILPFGNQLGGRINLQPLRPVYLAVKYGAVNGGMAIQLLLNILMFLPLGFLIPIIFKRHPTNFWGILSISFILSSMTELTQYLTGRSVDIDDLIANSIGGLLGFALFIFHQGVLHILKVKPVVNRKNYRSQFLFSVSLLIITISPFIIIKVLAQVKEIGYVYYGHPIPTSIEIPESISNQEGSATIYKIEQTTSLEELKSRLLDLSDFDCEFEEIGNETYRCGEPEDLQVIFIYPDLIWSVFYQFGQNGEKNKDPLLVEEAILYAKHHLDTYRISSDSLNFTSMQKENADGYYHLTFEQSSADFENFIWGSIFITINSKGNLVSISDNRMNFHSYQTVDTISPRKSIEIARDIGLGDWNGMAKIKEIRPSYFFNPETGFLIPTWQIMAEFTSDTGQLYSWQPNIDATKHLTW
jgi:glycopeptide antibiotics resistance protein